MSTRGCQRASGQVVFDSLPQGCDIGDQFMEVLGTQAPLKLNELRVHFNQFFLCVG
jgi:hypothetical protein